MKRICLIIILVSTTGFAQQKKLSFTAKLQDSLKLQMPDFGYYSKNYTSVFGTHQYTLDRDRIKKFSIYAAPDGNYYSLGDGRFVPTVPMAGNTAMFASYTGSDIFSGVISALTGQNFSLGYTIWDRK